MKKNKRIDNDKPLAIFDIDGTIFRSSLLIELQLELINYGIFPQAAEQEIASAYRAWLNRHGSYEYFIHSVISSYGHRIKNCAVKDIKKVSRLVIQEHKNRVYRFTRDLIKKLRRHYSLIAISGSPLEIVKEFNRHWKFDYIFGTSYEINKNQVYTGRVLETPVGKKREILLKFITENKASLKNSIGVGDTESDISFLSVVAKPIAFNPNAKLFKQAKRKHWQVIVERKDVIYTL